MQRKAMTILQVSPTDIGGGAEKVAFDLHQAYLARGLDAWLAVALDQSHALNVIEIPHMRQSAWSQTLLRAAGAVSDKRKGAKGGMWALDRFLRLAATPRRMSTILRGHEDHDFPSTARLLELTPTPPHILHLHNLHGAYFDLRRLPQIAAEVPTIITMHDVWLLTGHCAYPMECDRWTGGCGDCPNLGRYVPIRRDGSEHNLEVKQRALSGGFVHLATPSKWLKGLVERSGVSSSVAETRVIPNGVDLRVFAPGDKTAARALIGLPDDVLVVLYAARSAKSSPFKGFDVLEAALPRIAQGLNGRPAMMLAVGQEASDTEIEGIPVRFVPFVEDPSRVATYYQAADIYLHPARAENMPLAVLEALACGVPVVASDAGGIPEVVHDGETGLLFANGESESLASATLSLVANEELRAELSIRGAELARTHYSLDRQVEMYLDWYAELAGDAT